MESHTTSTADVAIGLISVVWEYAEEFLDVDGLDANANRNRALGACPRR